MRIKKIKEIKDALYGFVKIGEVVQKIIDSKEFQRLRWIRQLGFSHLVYPSAVHTRFEHSLGSYYLAYTLLDYFDEDYPEFYIAALVHDVGHLPFSHTLESFFKRHEKISEDIVKTRFAEILEKHGIDVKKVVQLIHGKGRWGSLISGDIDVDRLDYLNRDAYYTGVAYGIIDYEAIMRGIEEIKGKRIYIREKYVPAFESLLIGRNQMYRAVYFHNTILSINAMVRRAFYEEMENIELEKMYEYGDFDVLFILRENPLFKDVLNRIIRKEVIRFEVKKSVDDKEIIDLEDEIVSETGMKKGDLLINFSHPQKLSGKNIIVKNSGESLEEYSSLVPHILKEKIYVHVFSNKKIDNKKLKKMKEILENTLS